MTSGTDSLGEPVAVRGRKGRLLRGPALGNVLKSKVEVLRVYFGPTGALRAETLDPVCEARGAVRRRPELVESIRAEPEHASNHPVTAQEV
jgi:hypothetical protein